MKSVAILGCGPAGLMVAHAAVNSGWDFRVYSRKVKSPLYGAQYLHAYIPGVGLTPGETVRYELHGTVEQYRRKVYGDIWDGTTSPEDLLTEHSAFDIRLAYDNLWRMYEDEVVNWTITPQISTSVFGAMRNTTPVRAHDLVISTVPRKIWAEPGDVFESTKVWALGDTELPRVDKPYRPPEFTVVCNGTPQIPWYRISNVFGYCTVEWPYPVSVDGVAHVIPAKGASVVEKPLRHNSTAASDFIHLGRYGAWQKGVLVSDVYFQAMQELMDDTISPGRDI